MADVQTLSLYVLPSVIIKQPCGVSVELDPCLRCRSGRRHVHVELSGSQRRDVERSRSASGRADGRLLVVVDAHRPELKLPVSCLTM
jgi:hypothetical protein